jgi:guanylate kinase
MGMSTRGMLLVISGPSGAGKGTLLNRIINDDPSFRFSVSVTTRLRRVNETEGVSYYFISDAQYDKLLNENAFIEHASVHGHRYGTLKSEVYKRLAEGMNVILDIDCQGALNVMRTESDCVSVFILPPSFSELRRRLERRKTDLQADIEHRLLNAKNEIAQASAYRYNIINENADNAYSILQAIIMAEKHNTIRNLTTITE